MTNELTLEEFFAKVEELSKWCAYDEIKDRKGKTVDGVFIKEEDLN